MSQRSPVTAPGAPEAIGPYSHAVRHGDVAALPKGVNVEIDAIVALA